MHMYVTTLPIKNFTNMFFVDIAYLRFESQMNFEEEISFST